MSELIEINEGNCVLSESELLIIDRELIPFRLIHIKDEQYKDYLKFIFDKIFLKITKLNDMAKEQK